MSNPLQPPSLLDQESIQRAISRYGWTAKPEPALQPSPGPVEVSSGNSDIELRQLRGQLEEAWRESSSLRSRLQSLEQELQFLKNNPPPVVASGPELDTLRDQLSQALKQNESLLKEKEQLVLDHKGELSGIRAIADASGSIITDLKREIEEKDRQIVLTSQQSEELKISVDDYEKKVFELQAEIRNQNDLLAYAGKLEVDLEKEEKTHESMKELENRHQIENKELKIELDKLQKQMVVEGEGPVLEILPKLRQQLALAGSMLQKNMEESGKLKSQLIELQEKEQALNTEIAVLKSQPAPAAADSGEMLQLKEKVTSLEQYMADLLARTRDAEASASNSKAALKHAMDFANEATKDNEQLKRKLQEAGLRI